MAKAKRSKSPESITDQLKAIIDDSGLSWYAIAKGAGIDQSAMQRFMHGERDLRLSSVDKLAEFFNLHLAKRR